MLSDFEPFSDFRVAAGEALKYLHNNFGFALWMVTRTEGEDWIVLQAEDHGYNVKEGDVFRWTDSFCSRMVRGKGPCVAPSSNQVPAYASAPIGQQVSISAYVGLPLTKPDGTLFGTLCAIDPECQPEALVEQLPQFEMISRLLGTILGSELKAEAEMRRAERAEAEAETDSLTKLFNRRGWDRLLAAEESRCRRYAHSASVISVDLDEFKKINDLQGHTSGDAMLVNAAQALRASTRTSDVVARCGGDEFAVLAIHCDQQQADQLVARMHESLAQFDLRGSIGVGVRNPAKTLGDAWKQADQNMYVVKRNRKRHTSDQTPQISSDLTAGSAQHIASS